MKSFKQWLAEDADDIVGIYPPEYEGIGNYPPEYFNSNIYIRDSLKNAKKRKKKHKKKD